MLQETVQNTLLEAQPWPAPACLKLSFGTETQVFFQLMQARHCWPWACSKLGSVHVSSLLSLLGGERVALD